ncbi:hypothetical protein BKA82DRAFT_515807 [Pisolithus tinctorius]|uniref:Uncharacterized protein n=1 Tax=Pisolithus tinctorius Marx 270 TaxID=870435 RepID=A0A0C3I8C4_PISTI|nr:hypothetical protein BKA82DRAFT_515807 [Pisolithus tinctorius]KIN93342.1 hypothetical protein M404DRAFT_515807 [Pisolithus tinctorius Marx 270]
MITTLDLDKFSVHELQVEEGLDDAFEHLNNALAISHIEGVVLDLLEKPGLFVYIFSVFPNAESLRTKILDAFPTDHQALERSFIPPLLSKLSGFFFSLPSDVFRGDESRTVGMYERCIADIWSAIATLSTMAFGTEDFRSTTRVDFRGKKITVSAHDATILRKLNIQPPSDSNVAMQTLGHVMATVSQILKVRR